MARSHYHPGNKGRCLWGPLAWGIGLVVGAGGCAGWWDRITDRNLEFKELFVQPDPLEVLRGSSSGARRGEALAALREPLRHGGTQEDQDKYLQILSAAALKDPEPLCRLGAVKSLSQYQDPQAVKILEEVYLQRLPFNAEMNSVLRQQALAGLEATAHSEARHLLIRVARQPAGSEDTNYQDRQQTLDERLTAVRALRKYKHYDAVQALVYVMENEKEVALKDRAHQSLQEATGKNLPADPRVWQEELARREPAPEPNLIQRVFGLP